MNEEDCEAKMSNENWTATDCGKYIRVRAPNGGICEMWGDADDAHQRFAYFVLRQMIRDLAAVTEDRDAYRVSSEIRGANIEAMHEVLIELSALLAGQATDFRQVARDLRRMARASLDCSTSGAKGMSASDGAAIQYAIGLIDKIPKATPEELEAHLTAVLVVFWSALWGSFGTKFAEEFISAQLAGMKQQSETYVRNVQ